MSVQLLWAGGLSWCCGDGALFVMLLQPVLQLLFIDWYCGDEALLMLLLQPVLQLLFIDWCENECRAEEEVVAEWQFIGSILVLLDICLQCLCLLGRVVSCCWFTLVQGSEQSTALSGFVLEFASPAYAMSSSSCYPSSVTWR